MIAAFDFVEIGDHVNSALELVPVDPVNEKFETLGLESTYFINNLGSFFLAIVFEFALFLIWLILAVIGHCSKRVRKARNKLGKKMYFNSWISMIFASSVMVLLCLMVTFKYNFDLNGKYGQNI